MLPKNHMQMSVLMEFFSPFFLWKILAPVFPIEDNFEIVSPKWYKRNISLLRWNVCLNTIWILQLLITLLSTWKLIFSTWLRKPGTKPEYIPYHTTQHFVTVHSQSNIIHKTHLLCISNRKCIIPNIHTYKLI